MLPVIELEELADVAGVVAPEFPVEGQERIGAELFGYLEKLLHLHIPGAAEGEQREVEVVGRPDFGHGRPVPGIARNEQLSPA